MDTTDSNTQIVEEKRSPVKEESSLIFAKVLNEKGGALSHSELSGVFNTKNPLWLHFDANHFDTVNTIRQACPDIDEYTLQAIIDEDARPRLLQLDNGVLIILRGINHNTGEEPEDMVAVRFWITDKRLISLRYRKSLALMAVSDKLDQGRGPKNIGDIFASISALLFSYIENTISQLEDNMDDLESRIVDEPDRTLRQDIAHVRKSAILLRRYISPQKEVMSQLRYSEISWLNTKNLRRVQETQDTILRCIEDLDAVRERSQIVKDELVNALSDKLNRNLYVISVVTAIFLPLGFLTSLFGINIGGMPGVNSDEAFALFSLGLVAIIIVQILLFKHFKWF